MNKRKVLFSALLAAAIIVGLSACGSGNNDNASGSPQASTPASASPTASTPASASAPPSGETVEITITATDFQFDQQEIKVHQGDTVKITLHNEKGVHGFEIKDFNVNIKDGETATFVADKAGTFDFNCSIQCGHGHDNMTGLLIVE
jgi:cytochrome c oxidase subunit II